MNSKIAIPQQQIDAFCRKWAIAELSLFGSILRDDFRDDSDIDVLVRFRPEASHSLFDIVRMKKELSQILGREVDLISQRGLESSRNYLRRREILQSAEVVYAA
jgi:uncharacterized protein